MTGTSERIERGADRPPITTLTELFTRAQDSVPALTLEVIDLIHDRVAEYGSTTVTQQIGHTEGQLRDMVTGLACGRGPDERELQAARDLGRQRALDRVPLHALISAFQVGFQRLWAHLQELARESGRQELQLDLLAGVDGVWSWMQAITAAASQAHSEATVALEAVDIRSTHRFVQALSQGDVERDVAERAAVSLGYDLAGQFQVVCWSVGGWSESQLQRWHERDGVPRPATQHLQVAGVGQTMVAVLQGADPAKLVTRVHRVDPAARVGVGLSRPGVPGAVDSYRDAVLCLAHADPRRPVVAFEQWWLPVSLSEQAPRLRQVLEPGLRAAVDNPHLLQTVTAFADAGSSLSATASALHVHVNTVRYRLDRWRTLTGWDPTTWDGLCRTLLVDWTRDG
ncbi:PucR family transcriptional regulator [Kineococcus sp. GCM10028916]|uniref:PucR family transcriptional regulator n=1 Tax=Kineococcus sp. GCM10028916 TaxID=3273394 RepID=UPI003645B47F